MGRCGTYPRGACVPRYTDPEEVQRIVDKYFEDCEGKPLTDSDGNVILTKQGDPVYIGKRPPTVTGLALALGFINRQSLLNYQAKPAFRDVITRAKSRVEQYTEERLFDKDGSNGAKFSLQFNFKGWKEDKPDEAATPTVKIICDIPRTATQTEGDEGSELDLDPENVAKQIKALENGGEKSDENDDG